MSNINRTNITDLLIAVIFVFSGCSGQSTLPLIVSNTPKAKLTTVPWAGYFGHPPGFLILLVMKLP